jgi:3-deoxy-D-manno-octulosonate cytidylyltransferase
MNFTVLIPARLASTRLPDKPLADLAGLPMVVHVARRAARSGASAVVVCADHERTLAACRAHGVQAVATRADHATGSDRLAEACERLGLDGDDLVVNVQGDEPLIDPALIDACAALLLRRPECVMSTAAHAIDDTAELLNPNVVKVVCDAQDRALLFSRAPLPWWRDGYARGPAPRHAARQPGSAAPRRPLCLSCRLPAPLPGPAAEPDRGAGVARAAARAVARRAHRGACGCAAAGPRRRHARGPGARARAARRRRLRAFVQCAAGTTASVPVGTACYADLVRSPRAFHTDITTRQSAPSSSSP